MEAKSSAILKSLQDQIAELALTVALKDGELAQLRQEYQDAMNRYAQAQEPNLAEEPIGGEVLNDETNP